MKISLLTILLSSFLIGGSAQPLSIGQTVSYLNKLAYENADFSHVFLDAIMEDDSCKIKVVYRINYDSLKTFLYIEEIKKRIHCPFNHMLNSSTNSDGSYASYVCRYLIDLSEIKDNDLKFNSSGEIEIGGETSKYEYDSLFGKYSRFGTGMYKLILTLRDNKYTKVYFHGLEYLISSAKQQIQEKKEDNIDDPFMQKESQQKNTSKVGVTKIPLMVHNGTFIIKVKIGGQLFSDFIFDTGAAECNISGTTERKLIEKGIVKQSDYLVNGLYETADGSIIENKRIKLSNLSIGNKSISNVIVSVGNANSPNLLGQSYLNRLDSWSIDNLNNSLIVK